jgi:hypothetical protein
MALKPPVERLTLKFEACEGGSQLVIADRARRV